MTYEACHCACEGGQGVLVVTQEAELPIHAGQGAIDG